METIADRIKKLRTIHLHEKFKMKFSQEEFGNKIGLSKSGVSKIEKGINNLTDQTTKLICKEFDVSEEWLIQGIGDPFVKVDTDKNIEKWVNEVMKGRATNFKKRLLYVLTTLKENEWEFLEQKARELLEEESNNSSNEINPLPTDNSPADIGMKYGVDLIKLNDEQRRELADACDSLQKKQTLSQSDWQEENQDENQTG